MNSQTYSRVLLLVLRFPRIACRFPPAIVVAALWLAVTAPSAWSADTGVVEGQVLLSLSKGTQLADEASPSQKKVPCAEYPVVVLSKDRRTKVAEVPVNAEGHFRIDLAPGDYLLDVKRAGRRRVLVNARPFSVVAGQTIRVDLDLESTIEPL